MNTYPNLNLNWEEGREVSLDILLWLSAELVLLESHTPHPCASPRADRGLHLLGVLRPTARRCHVGTVGPPFSPLRLRQTAAIV